MRNDLYTTGPAMDRLRGQVKHALKVVGSPPLPGLLATPFACGMQPDLCGRPLVAERAVPFFNPDLALVHPACTRRFCPAQPAGPGLHPCGSDCDRTGHAGEGHIPSGIETDPRIAWRSGTLPVDPQFVRQFVPALWSASGWPVFGCGPRPSTVGGFVGTGLPPSPPIPVVGQIDFRYRV